MENCHIKKVSKLLLYAFVFLTISLFFSGCKRETVNKNIEMEVRNIMPGKKVVMIIAKNNFRDEEYFEPKKIFINAGVEVITASSSLEEATGMFKGKVKPDILIDDIDVDDYDAVVFIGGSGSSEYFDNKVALRIAKETYEKKKIVGAICIAPVTLANAGILKGKKTSVYASEKNTVISKGAKYTTEGVSVDGNIITASGPQFATDFGMSLRKLILGK